jgi:hypothetical protein
MCLFFDTVLWKIQKKPAHAITLEKVSLAVIREGERKDPFQQEKIKKIQYEILWLEQQLLKEHPLLNKQFPPQYREDFEEWQTQTEPLRKELARSRRKHTLAKKDQEETKQRETLRLQSLCDQLMTTQQHPLYMRTEDKNTTQSHICERIS